MEKNKSWISTRVTFLIYINDLPDQINSFCKMFLGDTFLFSKVYDINTSVSKLNADLEMINY